MQQEHSAIYAKTQTAIPRHLCLPIVIPGMTEKIVEMAINSSGIRETARVLKINKNTVINTLKKENRVVHSNTHSRGRGHTCL